VCVCVCVCVHIYIQRYTHTHTHSLFLTLTQCMSYSHSQAWRVVLHTTCSIIAMLVTMAYQLLSIFSPPFQPTSCEGLKKKTNVSGRGHHFFHTHAQGRAGGGGAGASYVADTADAPGEIDNAPGEIEVEPGRTRAGEVDTVAEGRRRCGIGEAGGVAAIVLCAMPSSAVDIWLLVSVDGGGQGLPGEEIKALWYFVFLRDMMLFIGTQFSNLYTAVHTPA
jgi:hypothetical protein